MADWIHISFVNDGSNIEDLLGVIKNFLILRQFRLHLHVVTTKEAAHTLTNRISTWKIYDKHFNLSTYDYSHCEPYAHPYKTWILTPRYTGGLCKIAIPYIISDVVRYLMVLDTDLVLLDGSMQFYLNCYYQYIRKFQIAESKERRRLGEREFLSVPSIPRNSYANRSYVFDIDSIRKISFNYSHLIPRPVMAIAPEQHDENTPVSIWPHLKEGTLNTGVMLIDCRGYRRHQIWEQILKYNYLEQEKRSFSRKETLFGDQNLLNLFLSDYISLPTQGYLREYTLVLPCSCNYIFPSHINDRYRRHVCPIEPRELTVYLDTDNKSGANSEERDRITQLRFHGRSHVISQLQKSETSLMNLMGWEQEHLNGDRQIKNRKSVIYIAHSGTVYKDNGHIFNRLRLLYIEFEEKYLRQINCWNAYEQCYYST